MDVFENIIEQNLNLSFCPECNSTHIEFVIQMPFYGSRKGIVRCMHCGREIVYKTTFSQPLFAEGRFGLPTTPFSIAKNIFKLGQFWNEEAEKWTRHAREEGCRE